MSGFGILIAEGKTDCSTGTEQTKGGNDKEMETVKIFVKEGCFLCPTAKEVGLRLEQEGLRLQCYDIDTADGLAEASYYGILSTPTMLIEDDHENLLADFRGTVPTVQQVKSALVR